MIKAVTKPSYRRLEFSERKWLLRTVDVVIILLGTIGAVWIWSLISRRPFDTALLLGQTTWMAMITVAWLLWLVFTDMYELRRVVNLAWCFRRIIAGTVVILLLYITFYFVTVLPFRATPEINDLLDLSVTPLRLAPVIAILATGLSLITWRACYAWALSGPHARRRVLILGAGAAGSAIANVLRGHSVFDVVGFIDDDPAKLGKSVHGVRVVGGHTVMLDVVESHSVDEIVVAISDQVKGSLFQTIMDCHERGITITPMPLLYEQLTGKVAVEHIGSQWYVALPFDNKGFETLGRLLKRSMDLVIGALLLIVFLITLPLIAALIRLDSRGSIFYTQQRMGQHGRIFRVMKYRSMFHDAECDGKPKWATQNDPRVTRVGRILRKTRLDELPQVMNVLRGEMSVVGPRPERPEFIAQLQKQIPFYRTRLAAKPGLTGWAQVNYGYGSTVEDALIKLQYDLYYLKHQSVWFDLHIVLRTIAVVLKMKGQ